MKAFEKLGAFYLGKLYDPETRAVRDDLLLYDSKDLTTHAVCVGMTGSGKTGLCLSLLEEAAIDGIPALAIDPKGDLGNLLLTFPELRAQDFRPWIDEDEAARKGEDPESHSLKVAALWKKGLAQWGQDGDRIGRFRDAADLNIYTPGSNAGLELTILRSFSAPPPALLQDSEAFRERIEAAVSGLLALLDIDADPVSSREYILLCNILERAWREGRDLDIPGLIRQIQEPPFDKIGVMDLESTFPAKDRFALAMRLNNLLASPGFASWLQGEPLDIQRLLWTNEGKPKISILSIAHLNDSERMFFVTILLNEVLAWMRTQPGTSSLRALLYMDEVFGFFPPVANPPSKAPMLTLLKQARAYGLGCVLATQNPVDLDYKGLSNAGTWFLGRLQTERDKARVLEGLEGASAEAGTAFDRQAVEATLARLESRVFLMNNVHDDSPALFHTRWVLSYLRGPLTREQIRKLMAARKDGTTVTEEKQSRPRAAIPREEAPTAIADRPHLPPDVPEFFLPRIVSAENESKPVYRPALLGIAKLHFSRVRLDLDEWRPVTLLAPLAGEVASNPWKEAAVLEGEAPEIEKAGAEGVPFAKLPAAAARAKSYSAWKKGLVDHLYRSRPLTIWRHRALKATSMPDENVGDFRVRLTQLARERRDTEIEKMRKRYLPKLAKLEERIRKGEERVSRETAQYKQQKLQSVISVGATILGALFGRKLGSVGNVGRASSAIRRAGRAVQERGDVTRVKEELEVLRKKLGELEDEFEAEVEKLETAVDPASFELEELEIPPKKSDIAPERVALVWTPWFVNPDGSARPAYLG